MKKGLRFWGVALMLLITITTLSFKNSISSASEENVGTKIISTLNASNDQLTDGQIFDEQVLSVYNSAGLESAGLDLEVFKKAMLGYHNLKDMNLLPNDKSILSVVDFTKSSTEKRFWVINLESKKVLFNTWVSHGQGSGDKMASNFSNLPDSYQSSVGFYRTAETYTGKHGRSLKLDGLDEGLNNKARSRSIVIHGADYVSQDFINKTGRLGRSQGCPALPMDLFSEVINNIKDNNLLFINGKGVDNSAFLKEVEHSDSETMATTRNNRMMPLKG